MDDHEWKRLWLNEEFDLDPDWVRLRMQQEDFAAFCGLLGVEIEPFEFGAHDADVLVASYGPLWRFAEIVWLPPFFTYEWYESGVGDRWRWKPNQEALLVRSDHVIETSFAFDAIIPPDLSQRRPDGSPSHRQPGYPIRMEGPETHLSNRIRQAVAEALRSWAQTEQPPESRIAEMLDDFYATLSQLPVLRLWEAGVVPIQEPRRLYTAKIDRDRPWLPDDFNPH